MKDRRTVLPEKGDDRISSLPDDLIQKILSFTGAKEAVQTSLLSTRWNNLWKSLSILNFDQSYFSQIPDFSRFVEQFLVHRDHQSDLSVFNLKCRCDCSIDQSLVVTKIGEYGAMHNLQNLTITDYIGRVPPSVFTCQSLNHLSFTAWSCQVLTSSLVLPDLTTLLLERLSFQYLCWIDDDNRKSVDLFSNLLNLRNLTLINCHTSGLQVFYIVSPQLENLHLTTTFKYDGIFFCPYKYVISAPKLSSFKYEGTEPLQIYANDLPCLDRVYMDISKYRYNHELKPTVCREIVNMFHQLRDAKFVALTEETINVLSSVLELLEGQMSPFCKMEFLKIAGGYCLKNSPSVSGVVTYLCNSSPNSKVIDECNGLFQDQ